MKRVWRPSCTKTDIISRLKIWKQDLGKTRQINRRYTDATLSLVSEAILWRYSLTLISDVTLWRYLISFATWSLTLLSDATRSLTLLSDATLWCYSLTLLSEATLWRDATLRYSSLYYSDASLALLDANLRCFTLLYATLRYCSTLLHTTPRYWLNLGFQHEILICWLTKRALVKIL
jgi:hypothetical protein